MFGAPQKNLSTGVPTGEKITNLHVTFNLTKHVEN